MRPAIARSEVDQAVAAGREVTPTFVDARLEPLTCLERVVLQVPANEQHLLRGASPEDHPDFSVAGEQHEKPGAHACHSDVVVLARVRTKEGDDHSAVAVAVGMVGKTGGSVGRGGRPLWPEMLPLLRRGKRDAVGTLGPLDHREVRDECAWEAE
jgi:hypothetical protein